MKVTRESKMLNECEDVFRAKGIHIFFLFLVLTTVLYMIWGIFGGDNKYKKREFFEIGSENRISSHINNNDIYEQEFQVSDEKCRGVSICFGTFMKKIEKGKIIVDISCGETNVFSSEYKLSNIKDNESFFILSDDVLAKGKYNLRLQFVDMQNNTPLVLYTSDSGRYPEYATRINNGLTECDISIDVLYSCGPNLYTLVCLFLCVLVIVCFVVVFVRIYKDSYCIERMFLGSAVVLGVVYLTIIPIGDVPDATVHMDNAYALSNKVLGIADTYDERGTVVLGMRMRQCDYNCTGQAFL